MQGLRELFASTRLRLDPASYVIVSLPPSCRESFRLLDDAEPFTSVTLERDEVSLILREEAWLRAGASYPEARVEGPYSLITFDIVLDLAVVGYMAEVSAALAREGVSIYPVSTYLRDHVFVKKEDAGKAVACLEKLIRESGHPIKEWQP